jgi:methionine-rich copper-binding protein CopC
VAAYSFNEGSGSTVYDSSGNGNNGTISNATWSTAGKYGDALVFNGTNALVTIPDAASLHLTTGMTLEAWVDPTTVSSAWRDLIYKGNDNYFLEATSTQGGVPAAGATVGTSDVATYGTSVLAANTWTYLTETYNGSALDLYVNGTLVSSLAETGNIATSTNPLQIGGDSIYGQYFQGLIDDVRVYNQALSQSQIQSDMNTPVAEVAPTVTSETSASAATNVAAAPTVTSETPASGATNVAVSTALTATFNEAVQSSTISFTLQNSSGSSVAGSVSYNSTTNVATFTPTSALASNTTYTATISGAQSTSGVSMTAPFSWSFTTASGPHFHREKA